MEKKKIIKRIRKKSKCIFIDWLGKVHDSTGNQKKQGQGERSQLWVLISREPINIVCIAGLDFIPPIMSSSFQGPPKSYVNI